MERSGNELNLLLLLLLGLPTSTRLVMKASVQEAHTKEGCIAFALEHERLKKSQGSCNGVKNNGRDAHRSNVVCEAGCAYHSPLL